MMQKKSLMFAAMVLVGMGAYAQRPGGGGGGQGGGRPQGQGERPSAAQMMAMLDKNNDGKIDKTEASNSPNKRFAENFDRLDANGDGFIDQAELSNMGRPNGEKPKAVNAKSALKDMDANKDGKLDKEEVSQKNNKALVKSFDKIDTNADGFLDKSELDAFAKETKDRRKDQE